jgi:ABC-type lipoprotein release transport system permease subunit
MNAWLLAVRSMRHYWRTQIGVLLGVICATTVLVGALSIGDSVRLSLRDQALDRVGSAASVLAAGDRFVQADLSNRITTALGNASCVPVMHLPGVASSNGGAMRTGIVDVYGIDAGFFAMSSSGQHRDEPEAGHALINQRLAMQLGVVAGDEIVLRVEKPSLMPVEATMATVDDVSFGLRVSIDDVVDESQFGRFGLRSSQVPPFNVFVSIAWLQDELQLPGRANMLLTNGEVDEADNALRAQWRIEDAELRVTTNKLTEATELTSSRVFLDKTIVDAVARIAPDAVGIVTYFVNSLKTQDKQTPYSMVSAIGPLTQSSANTSTLPELRALVPTGTGDDQIVCNQWLAEDLGVKPGDTVEVTYTVMNSALQFQESSHQLQVHSIVPMTGAATDSTLMPPFPGLSEAKSCRDWEPGIPVDLQQLDDRDQKYWDQYKGTPKAFVTLATGQQLWSNRFGTLTAIRTSQQHQQALEQQLPRLIDPKALNLQFQDLRGPAIAAGIPATDFGSLYLGLSFFLILAALLLTAMLFAFGVEQRQSEIGTLLAVGYEQRTVRWLFIREAIVLATVGSLIGSACGAGYTHAVLHALDTMWRDTVGQTTLVAHIVPSSMATGASCAVLAALTAITLAMRRAFRRPAIELLQAGTGENDGADSLKRRRGSNHIWIMLGITAVAGAAYLIANAQPHRATSAFFGGGALLLIATLIGCRTLLARLAAPKASSLATIAALALRNTSRRPHRSVATISLLASGTFLVVAIQANRLTPPTDASVRSSGTGGFALFGRSTLPILRDLASDAGRDAYALDDEELADVEIVPLRVRDGDDASCLNLSTAQNPQLASIQPHLFAQRECFRFTRTEAKKDATESPWLLLNEDYGDDVVPAIGDGGSVAWALHKKLGDSLQYRDESGRDFKVRIVATVADSILQGNLIISDRHMLERFPSASGYRMFLIDAPTNRADQVATDLGRALEDIGLELTSTAERLAMFQSVQNTYLWIFQLLGGLGLLLGTVGLGVVVLRNALERRVELAIAGAVGFPSATVRNLVFCEHAVLLGLGLICGLLAASVALLPALQVDRGLPLLPITGFIAAIGLSGVFWVWLASALATRGKLIDGLRGE